MAEISVSNGNHAVVLNVDAEANPNPPASAFKSKDCGTGFSVPFMQKLMAEVLGTYFLIFAGCASLVVNVNNKKVLSLPGISMVWGLAVMVLVYSVGHISGAHFNPAVTIAFASCKRFPLKQKVENLVLKRLNKYCSNAGCTLVQGASLCMPAYVLAQVIGSTLAAGTLRLLFSGPHDVFAGSSPQGSNLQAFVVEFIITFYLMFIISGVATDNRAIGELAGLAIGATVVLNVLFAGPITGASMNPARSLGPAIVSKRYKGIWIYLTSPILGAVSGAWVYNLVRYTDRPLREITNSASFLKSSRNCS